MIKLITVSTQINITGIGGEKQCKHLLTQFNKLLIFQMFTLSITLRSLLIFEELKACFVSTVL